MKASSFLALPALVGLVMFLIAFGGMDRLLLGIGVATIMWLLLGVLLSLPFAEMVKMDEDRTIIRLIQIVGAFVGFISPVLALTLLALLAIVLLIRWALR